jgi:hypothetical protein
LLPAGTGFASRTAGMGQLRVGTWSVNTCNYNRNSREKRSAVAGSCYER